ncbi:unnamed protein product [Didymodactylos carnosus]|uniref:Uncharacterized protein n=1 Tax=Didymodactylos carnosus TaxID=1234261 RepID=A0A815BU45_9BILA|nr:unnamed protein product [Didymodactylos carnosus]CAF1294886.1 unnamed protein product [Didymodactylos carnosus]CAF4064474.1 unnamed protein product [Didymodactylos carnosus]CAF4100204.1 unnamed protein product [Didymodactylos carnosus]
MGPSKAYEAPPWSNSEPACYVSSSDFNPLHRDELEDESSCILAADETRVKLPDKAADTSYNVLGDASWDISIDSSA